MSPDYLTDLNKEQCRAAKHGIDSESATKAPPLLVIAGAGSGKTKTLAHRVAHLVVSGVDPHRILPSPSWSSRCGKEIRRGPRSSSWLTSGTPHISTGFTMTAHCGPQTLRD